MTQQFSPRYIYAQKNGKQVGIQTNTCTCKFIAGLLTNSQKAQTKCPSVDKQSALYLYNGILFSH